MLWLGRGETAGLRFNLKLEVRGQGEQRMLFLQQMGGPEGKRHDLR